MGDSVVFADFSMPPLSPITLEGDEIIADLQWLIFECSQRCLTDAVKWASEVLTYCHDEMYDLYDKSQRSVEIAMNPYEVTRTNRHVVFGRSLLQCQDLHRASFHFEKVKELNAVNKFLYYWSRYLAAARQALENEADVLEKRGTEGVGGAGGGVWAGPPRQEHADMAQLHTDLLKEKTVVQLRCRKGEEPHIDIFLEYLIGRVEMSLGQIEIAWTRFALCVRKEPRFWPAYECLVQSVSTESQIEEVLGDRLASSRHWMHHLFECYALSKVQQQRKSIQCAQRLCDSGLRSQPILLTHISAVKHEIYENEEACELFASVLKIDPYRVDGIDSYADALFVMNNRVDLVDLSHRFYKTHRFKWETCMVVGNYYSLRADHDTAIRFFQRALRLNPYSARCWTLIGHEFMELKNNAAACLAYRRASVIDPRDHAPYYGLGNMYDILKMHTYALRYYALAHKCRPQDSRMLVALGEVYVKLSRLEDAQQCFLKAYMVGDVEGNALICLGKMYSSNGQEQHAAQVYEKYLSVYQRADDENLPECLLFLARHYLKEGKYDLASEYATQCVNYDRVREEGKTIQCEANIKLHEQQKVNQSSTSANDTDMAISEGEAELSFE